MKKLPIVSRYAGINCSLFFPVAITFVARYNAVMARVGKMYIDADEFDKLAGEYKHRWDVDVYLAGVHGELVYGSGEDTPAWRAAVLHAVNESLRWGRATFCDKPDGYVIWAVPVMHNSLMMGGVVAWVADNVVFADDGKIHMDLPAAAEALRIFCEKMNFTNASLLEKHRDEHDRQRHRAEAIHELKECSSREVFDSYRLEEPKLISAIRRGNRAEAVEIINRTLAAIYFLGGSRLSMIKSLMMELVIMMGRTAMDAGGSIEEILGRNFSNVETLSRINSEEELAHWISELLNNVIDLIETTAKSTTGLQLGEAVDYIRHNYDRPLTRDGMAEAVGMSPSGFSHMLKDRYGLSFTDLLNKTRIDAAARLLRKTDKSLLQIALETGFADQSYFTKVFRKYMKVTPRDYRNSEK